MRAVDGSPRVGIWLSSRALAALVRVGSTGLEVRSNHRFLPPGDPAIDQRAKQSRAYNPRQRPPGDAWLPAPGCYLNCCQCQGRSQIAQFPPAPAAASLQLSHPPAQGGVASSGSEPTGPQSSPAAVRTGRPSPRSLSRVRIVQNASSAGLTTGSTAVGSGY